MKFTEAIENVKKNNSKNYIMVIIRWWSTFTSKTFIWITKLARRKEFRQ